MSRTVRNLGADPHQWELLESKRGADLEKALYAWPAFTRTFQTHARSSETGEIVPVPYQEPPRAWLFCPRGHRILKVELNVDHNWHLSLDAAPEDSEVPANEQRVHGARWSARKLQQVCAEPDCPALGSSLYCNEHDSDDVNGTAINEVRESRLKVDCPNCPFVGVYRHSRLLALFAWTVANQRRAMRLRT